MLDCLAQLPNRDTLNDQPEGNDERGCLRWRQEMQPHRCGNDAESKAGQTGDKRGRECRGDE